MNSSKWIITLPGLKHQYVKKRLTGRKSKYDVLTYWCLILDDMKLGEINVGPLLNYVPRHTDYEKVQT
jgi:hypothetical protein